MKIPKELKNLVRIWSLKPWYRFLANSAVRQKRWQNATLGKFLTNTHYNSGSVPFPQFLEYSQANFHTVE